MRDPSLRRVVHVDAHRFVGEVGLRHRGRDLPLLLVRQLDATDHLDDEIDVDERDSKGNTLLHVSAQNGR